VTGRHLVEALGLLGTILPALPAGPRLAGGLLLILGFLVVLASMGARACGAR
jgi:hypothetical protein